MISALFCIYYILCNKVEEPILELKKKKNLKRLKYALVMPLSF